MGGFRKWRGRKRRRRSEVCCCGAEIRGVECEGERVDSGGLLLGVGRKNCLKALAVY
jgi:hypothetical protein